MENIQEKQEESTPEQNKPTKKKNFFIIFTVLGVIVIGLSIILFLGRPTSLTISQEILNITYSIELENGTIIESGTNEFIRGQISSNFGFVTNKVDEIINSMKEKDSRTIELDAKDAYGPYEEENKYFQERIRKQNRTFEINRTIFISFEAFEENFGEKPEIGKMYNTSGMMWPYRVVEKNETHVKLIQEPTLNQEIAANFFSYKVVAIDKEKIKIRIEGNNSTIPSKNGNYEIRFTEKEVLFVYSPSIGQEVQLETDLQKPTKARVVGMNETHVFLDGNHIYAGKKIILKITLNNIYRKTITGKNKQMPGAPTLEVFIMSYCPFGIQALKGLIPVWEKFEGKANIEVRFVSYIMHGKKEEEENERMVCIREEQNEKFLPYLKCFVESGDSNSCIQEAKIDKSKLNSCMEERVKEYLKEDNTLNEKYGVRGSPTYVLDGKEIEIYPRDPQSVANALCNAFKEKPRECSLRFSTQNPSPGFGTSVGGVGGGKC
ncbi:MAG: hypothetical protein NZ889_02390 [Candidatus Pacearchaeota archaeon]|nr:hypothetical protein [Candidatus Pacearchaeota archaeon]